MYIYAYMFYSVNSCLAEDKRLSNERGWEGARHSSGVQVVGSTCKGLGYCMIIQCTFLLNHKKPIKIMKNYGWLDVDFIWPEGNLGLYYQCHGNNEIHYFLRERFLHHPLFPWHLYPCEWCIHCPKSCHACVCVCVPRHTNIACTLGHVFCFF